MKAINTLFNTIFPKLCISCGGPLTYGTSVVCHRCLHQLPQTNFHTINNNKVEKIFYGKREIIFATAFLSYHKKGKTQNLIHSLKYKGEQDIGTVIGNQLADRILDCNLPKIDYVVAVPLHKNREKIRGYNQVDYFGKALAQKLMAKYSKDNLLRVSFTETQTKKSRIDRMQNVSNVFLLTNPEQFQCKTVLLIDDVITTGATLDACLDELEKSIGIKLAIACMAISE